MPADSPLSSTFAARATTSVNVRIRLYAMMFLQYFAQGCYLPIMSVYAKDALGFDQAQLGYFQAALAIGPLFAPFVLGQLIDRHFATERVLAAAHLLSGPLMILLFFQTSFAAVALVGSLYSILFVPSQMVTNSLAFHHLKNRGAEFPFVRLWGTIGFILPAWFIEYFLLSGLQGEELDRARGVTLLLAGLTGIILGFYSLTLPHTPPVERRDRAFAPLAVLAMLRQRHFLVLVVVSFFVAMVHQYHWLWNGPFLKSLLRSGGVLGAWEQRISSLGQIGEIAVMACLGMLLARLGFKATMLVGLVSYFARCAVFAVVAALKLPFAAAMTLTCFGEALHGLCFGCFMAVAYIYVDRVAPADIRGSMQSVYGTFVLGLGLFIGGVVGGWVGSWALPTSAAGEDNMLIALSAWTNIWLAGGALAAACVVVFSLGFPRTTLSPSGDG